MKYIFVQKLHILKFGGVTFGAQLLWGRSSAELLSEVLSAQSQKCGPQSHSRHGIAVDERNRGSCIITGRSVSHQWALGPPPAKPEPAGTSPSSYRGRIRALHPAAAVAKTHTCGSLTSALPNNSEVLLGVGKLLKQKKRSARSCRE